jgi:hypothetical protein
MWSLQYPGEAGDQECPEEDLAALSVCPGEPHLIWEYGLWEGGGRREGGGGGGRDD